MDSGEEGMAGYICRITRLSEQSVKQVQTIRGLFSLSPGSADKEQNHLSLFTELCFLLKKEKKKKKNWQVDKNPTWRCPLHWDKCYSCSAKTRIASHSLSPVPVGTYYTTNKSSARHLYTARCTRIVQLLQEQCCCWGFLFACFSSLCFFRRYTYKYQRNQYFRNLGFHFFCFSLFLSLSLFLSFPLSFSLSLSPSFSVPLGLQINRNRDMHPTETVWNR